MANSIESNPSLVEAMATVHPSTLKAMKRRLVEAMNERIAFEYGKAPNAAHIELRKVKRFIRNREDSLARLLCVLNADPQRLLNYERKAGYRSDLKGIMRLQMLIRYLNGESGKFERSAMALFAATIIAAKQGREFVSNNELELILSNCPVGSFNPELQDAIADWQNRFVSLEGDARPEACRWRTTYDNLGVYELENASCEDSNRNGVRADMSNPLIAYLASRWGI